MWQKKEIQTNNDEIQNRFTGYLLTSIQRKKRDYISKLYLRQDNESAIEDFISSKLQIAESEIEQFPILHVLDNMSLWRALNQLSDRELYVLLQRVVEERSFDELAKELGIGYKGVAAIYYRTVKKVRIWMKEEDKK